MKRTTIFLLLAALFFFYLAGCATVKKTFSYFGIWKTETRYKITDRDVSEFVSRVRPVPGNPDSHHWLAAYYLERGRYQEALEEFRKVVAIDPGRVKAYNGMGICYDNLQDYGRAVAAYQSALKMDPNLGEVYNNLGYSYMLQGKTEDSVKAFEKAVALKSGNLRIHNNLGMAYGLNQQFDRALAEFELGGDRACAHYNLAQLYDRHGMVNEARNHFSEALIHNPSFAAAGKGFELCDDRIAVASREWEPKGREAALSAETGAVSDSSPELKEAAIEISNGNGVNRMARSVGRYLERKGFKVVRFTNADHFHYGKAGVYYQKEYYDIARQVADEIPGLQDLRLMSHSDRPDIHVKVLIGEDLIPYRPLFAGGQS